MWLDMFERLVAFVPVVVLTVVVLIRVDRRRMHAQTEAMVALHTTMVAQHATLTANAHTCHTNSQALCAVRVQLHNEIDVHNRLAGQLARLEDMLETSNTKTQSILNMTMVVDELLKRAYPDQDEPEELFGRED